jgi:hypothetical protein
VVITQALEARAFGPKPGRLTQSPCLKLLELVGFLRKKVFALVQYGLLAIKSISSETPDTAGVTQLDRS